MVPTELNDAISEIETDTGVSINRIVSAAFLKYLLTHEDGDPWIKCAVALCKGRTDLATIRAEFSKKSKGNRTTEQRDGEMAES